MRSTIDAKEDLFSAFYEEPKPLSYILPGMMEGTVGSIVSPGGMGKSFFAFQLATQIAGGPDLLGLGKLTPGKVVYLPAEDPLDAIKQRMFALSSHLDSDQKQEIKKNLDIDCLLGSNLTNLLEKKSFDYIRNVSMGKRLVVIDTLRRFHREDENASGPMTDVIDRLEAICLEAKCSLLFLHHTSKHSSSYGEKSQASRGSGVLIDNIRWQGQLIGMTQKEAATFGIKEELMDYLIKFRVCKQNYGPPVDDLWMVRTDGGILKTMPLGKRR